MLVFSREAYQLLPEISSFICRIIIINIIVTVDTGSDFFVSIMNLEVKLFTSQFFSIYKMMSDENFCIIE